MNKLYRTDPAAVNMAGHHVPVYRSYPSLVVDTRLGLNFPGPDDNAHDVIKVPQEK